MADVPYLPGALDYGRLNFPCLALIACRWCASTMNARVTEDGTVVGEMCVHCDGPPPRVRGRVPELLALR